LDGDDGPSLAHLDLGEREAISLALQLRAELVLIDERDGRMAAEACGLSVAGTLRVLAEGAAIGLVSLTEALARLRLTTFRVNPRLMELLLENKEGTG